MILKFLASNYGFAFIYTAFIVVLNIQFGIDAIESLRHVITRPNPGSFIALVGMLVIMYFLAKSAIWVIFTIIKEEQDKQKEKEQMKND